MGRTIEVVARPATLVTDVPVELDLGLPPRLTTRRPGRRGVSEAMASVADFHVTFGLPINPTPHRPVDSALGELRVELLREEFEEFRVAVEAGDVVAIADALGDVVYVAFGSALTYGIDLDAVIREVHRANMSKVGPDGQPLLREDGKVMKSESYSPPDLRRVLLDQPPLFLD